MLDETRRKAVWLYKSVREAHEQTIVGLERIKNDVAKKPELELICDATALLKKAEELAKDMRKELNATLRQLQKAGCMLFLRDGLLGESCKTAWVSARPDTKTLPPIPRKSDNPEAYRAFAQHFGVPEALIESGAFKPHWPSIVDYVTSAESNGQTMPPGIDPTSCTTEYTLVCRFNKDVEPDSIVQEVMEADPYSHSPSNKELST